MIKRAVCYARVSTTEQSDNGVSLAAQESRLRAWCLAMGVECVEVVIDAGVSAKSLQRDGVQRALGMLRSGKADAIVVCKLDRLTRSIRDLCDLIDDYFRDGKYGLVSLAESVDTSSAMGRAVLAIMTAVGQLEREQVAERTSTALQHLKAQGRRVGSVPFGYALSDDGVTLVRVEAEQLVIARAAELRAHGLSLRAVGETLASEGHRSRGGRAFAAEQVNRMLSA